MRGIATPFVVGALLGGSWFALCVWASRLPVISDVSLAYAFQPWWRNWPVALVVSLLPVAWVFAFRALRQLCGVHTGQVDAPERRNV